MCESYQPGAVRGKSFEEDGNCEPLIPALLQPGTSRSPRAAEGWAIEKTVPREPR